jgi:hypothetical protein
MTDRTFCCEQMRRAVEDPDVPLIYTAKFDEFGVRVLDGGSSTIALEHCPWSGDKLPPSLRDAWFKELDRLGLDPLSSDLPAEFTDERWYTK